MVIADTLWAPSAETMFGHPFPLYALDAWLGVIVLAFQMLFDSGGYSLTAIGAALAHLALGVATLLPQPPVGWQSRRKV